MSPIKRFCKKIKLFGINRRIEVYELVDEFAYLKAIRNSTAIFAPARNFAKYL
jgi:hypothetical protein